MGLQVEKAGARERGIMFGITGQSGAGKTTLASTWPNPLVLDLEGGSWVLEEAGTAVHRAWDQKPKGRLDEFLGVLRDVAKTDYATVVVDSFTRLSDWVEADILEEDGSAESLMNAMGGYGKGRDAHVARVAKVIEALQWMQESRRKHIVIIMHTLLGQVDLPSGESYSHFGTEGVKKSATKVIQACDVVAMLRQHITVSQAKGQTTGKVRGKGDRELLTGSVPYADVKSRFARGEQIIPVEIGQCPFQDVLGG